MNDTKGTLRVEGLKKTYGRKTAVQDVSFSMEKGEIVGLLGPNGAGKTTVFYMIVGFIRATAGKIFLDTHDITHLPMYKRARAGISYLPQEASVFRKLSVEDNILAILEARKDLSKHEADEKTGKTYYRSRYRAYKKTAGLYTLSGGERRAYRDSPGPCHRTPFPAPGRTLCRDRPYRGVRDKKNRPEPFDHGHRGYCSPITMYATPSRLPTVPTSSISERSLSAAPGTTCWPTPSPEVYTSVTSSQCKSTP